MDDTLYVLVYDGSSDSLIYSFETNATTLSYTWKSKKFVDPHKYTCAKIKGDFTGGTTATFKYYRDGSLKQTKSSIGADTYFRLASDPGASDKEFELTGTAEIDSLQIATSPSELI